MSIVLSGSLILTGSISASGNLTTLGTITAQTLVVQTITSSIVNMTGSNIFGSRSTDRQTFTGSMFVTGSGTFTSTISAIGESTLFQGAYNDPVPNTVAVLKMSSTPTPSLASTVVGARMTGNPTINFDSYAGYFSNIAVASGNGMSYGIFATASFHTFIGETRFAQGVFNDPINGTAASVKISATPRSGAPTAVFTVGITGTASSGQNTFAGYFTNTSTVSGGGVNYGIYATGSNHFFGGSVGIGITAPSSILHISSSSNTITGKVLIQSPSNDSGQLQIGSSNAEASMLFIPGVTAFGTTGAPTRTSSFGNAALWGLGPGTYTSDPTKFGITNIGFGNNILTVSSSGALGIGTINPTSRLFVLGAGSYNTTTSEILTSDATIFSSEMSNDAYNSILQLVSVRQSLSTGASSNGFLGFSTIDDSNGEGIRDAGRIAIVNETAAARNSATALSFWTNTGGTKTTAATERMRITSGGDITMGGTGALKIQSGTTAQRPTASTGQLRYNTSFNFLEYYDGSNWVPVVGQTSPGSSASNPAESADEIKTYNPNATNGLYWIRQIGTVPVQAYCVFTDFTGAAIAGGPWTVPLISNDANTNFSTNGPAAAATFLSKCQAIGIASPGRGMESTRTTSEVYGAWLAVKRALWDGYSAFITNGNTGAGSVLRMPMININGEGGASAQRLVYNTSLSTHIPPNIDGDACNASQLFCGWWGANDASGWRTNDNSLPGPEDWGPSDTANTSYNGAGIQSILTVCVYK